MEFRNIFLGAMSAGFCFSALAAGTPDGILSYKLDGKPFSFKNGAMEYYKADGYISLVAERVTMIPDPTGPKGEKREVNEGMSIQLAKPEKELAGEHRSSTPDEMPTHFTWYKIVPAEDGKGKMIKDFMATLDSGDEKKKFIYLRINSFGRNGSMIQGTFNGRLFDEDGKLHEVTEGVFSVPRKDVE